MPSRRDGRIEPGQPLRTAVSAAAWNRAQDAADVVLGQRQNTTVDTVERFLVIGKTSAGWSKGTAANIAIWSGPPGNERATGGVIRAWNKFAAVPTGKWVMLARIGQQWYLMAAEC